MTVQNIKSSPDIGSAYMADFYFYFKDAGKLGAHVLLSSFLVQLAN
jgi:hypothetical protein